MGEMRNPFRARPLSPVRIGAAIAIAMLTDLFQIGLGPLGWTFLDEGADVVAMVLISLLIGFHPLLLPTFVVEFFPLVDMLPTWTGCVGAVIILRKRAQTATPPVVTAPPNATPPDSATGKMPDATGPVIDV